MKKSRTVRVYLVDGKHRDIETFEMAPGVWMSLASMSSAATPILAAVQAARSEGWRVAKYKEIEP